MNFENNVLKNSVPTMYVDFQLLEFLLVSRIILIRTFAVQRIGLTEANNLWQNPLCNSYFFIYYII